MKSPKKKSNPSIKEKKIDNSDKVSQDSEHRVKDGSTSKELSDEELAEKYDTGEEIDFPKVVKYMIPYPFDKKK